MTDERLTPVELLESKGWTYHVATAAWYHIGKGLGELGMHAALKEEGYAVLHRWDERTGFCMDCGLHIQRARLEGRHYQCDGMPDPQAFLDRAQFDWFEDRMQQIMENGGEGFLFIMGLDLEEDEDAT